MDLKEIATNIWWYIVIILGVAVLLAFVETFLKHLIDTFKTIRNKRIMDSSVKMIQKEIKKQRQKKD